ncbi:MAG: hypoxanthine phosphoribosyltransferase [Armatimonadetes bacterium]|nr:hypoxanthine phosphoribosyltransferase [Armatimonadota bacterium]MBS1700481.1 hypoxanthine phosphoribosyltransferase [Armatimonadota bacterium]MBS1725256.1 hypoxanthine phosphoribosyltransferase [Armatimonadota bacterium]
MRLEVLISSDEIQSKVRELAQQIDASIPKSDQPIILLGILKGSVHFLSDLSRALWDLGRDCHLEFMQVSSWHGETSSSGVVQIKKDLDSSIEDRDVVIVEDILDTGRTLSHLRELLGTRRPRSLQICALLSKPDARIVNVECEYIGFPIPNKFVVGYGLDFDERFRNLPTIAVFHQDE